MSATTPTSFFKVVATDPKEEYILGGPVEVTTSYDDLPRCTQEQKKNKIMESEMVEPSLDDDNDIEGKLDKSVKGLKNHEKTSGDYRKISDSVFNPKIKPHHGVTTSLQNLKRKKNEIYGKTSCRDKDDSHFRSKKVECVNKNLQMVPAQEVVLPMIIPHETRKRHKGRSVLLNSKFNSGKFVENSHTVVAAKGSGPENSLDNADDSSLIVRHPSRRHIKLHHEVTTRLQNLKQKNMEMYEDTSPRDEDNSLFRSNEVKCVSKNLQNVSTQKLVLPVIIPQETRRHNKGKCVNKLKTSHSFVSTKGSELVNFLLHTNNNRSSTKQAHSSTSNRRHFNRGCKTKGVDYPEVIHLSGTGKSFKSSRDSIHIQEMNLNSTTIKICANKNNKRENEFSEKPFLLSSPSTKLRKTIRPSQLNFNVERKLEPIEPIEVLDKDLKEVSNVKRNEQINCATIESRPGSKHTLQNPVSNITAITSSITDIASQNKDMTNIHSDSKHIESVLNEENDERCMDSSNGADELLDNTLTSYSILNNQSPIDVNDKNCINKLQCIANSLSDNNTKASFEFTQGSVCKKRMVDESVSGKSSSKDDQMLRNGDISNNSDSSAVSLHFGVNQSPPQGHKECDKKPQLTQSLPQLKSKEYICNLCDKMFQSKQNLKRHVDNHSDIKKFACLTCCKAYMTKYSLRYHIQNAHSTEIHKCNQCSKEFKSRRALHVHCYRYHSEETAERCRIKCDLCSKKFRDKVLLNEHKWVKHSIGYDRKLNFICHHCSSKFLNKELLKNHIFMKHMAPMFQCNICFENFISKPKLNYHLRAAHLIDKRKSYVCDTCGKVSKCKYKLEMHSKIHTGELQFVCEECGKCFRTPSNLDQHSRTHLDIRPFTCNLCDKAFRIKHHLKQHMAVHGMVSTANYRKRSDSKKYDTDI